MDLTGTLANKAFKEYRVSKAFKAQRGQFPGVQDYEGKVVEVGTHEALMARNGVYAELHRIQTPEEATAGSDPLAAAR